MRQAILIPVLLALLGGAAQGWAADFPDQVGSGYFRQQDTLPGRYRLYLQEQGKATGIWGLGPGHGRISKASFKMDAHQGVDNFSPRRLCVDCHKNHRRDMHMTRMNITCVQCHRGQPISGVHHYYSPMNPIRRHAYVCAKCHEGSTPSFAAYVVHEPNPLKAETREAFPLLFWATWFMVVVAVGVFVIFLPYVALWWLREWFDRAKEAIRNE
jgi:hypothetical protein